MATISAQVLTSHPAIRRALHQQGVGGRAKVLRNRMIRRMVALCLFVIVLSVIQVWTRMQVLELRYAMTGMQKQVDTLQQQLSRLDHVMAALKAPERLERIAKEELGMQQPTTGQVVFIRESTQP